MANDPIVRQLKVTAVMFDSTGTAVATYTHEDKIKEFTISRTGEKNKFFGFGVTGKLNLHLIDPNRELNITTDNYFRVLVKNRNVVFPLFYVTEVHRDDVTNELSITAYDAIYFFSKEKIQATAPYTIKNFIYQSLGKIEDKYHLGSSTHVGNLPVNGDIEYAEGGNFDDIDTLRDALNAVAEVTGSVYSMMCYWQKENVEEMLDGLLFCSPGSWGGTIEITPEDYFSLKVGTNRRLKTLGHVTELGDNIIYSEPTINQTTGTTQYFRNNAFLELIRPQDADDILEALVNKYHGMTIGQFECEWRGKTYDNANIIAGAKLHITDHDGNTIESYNFNDTFTYNGAFRHKMELSFDALEEDTYEANPTNIGEALKKTYARVDKTNKVIELVASDVADNQGTISQLIIDTSGIKTSVENVQKAYEESVEGINQEIGTLTKKVEATMSAEDVKIEIKTELDKGIDKVETSTGFTFNEEGLTVAKSGSEMKTTITEDGMHIYRDSTEVLIADNEGVWAEDLHATTYLIVGNSSRFEDYTNASGETRTGCFWIGG